MSRPRSSTATATRSASMTSGRVRSSSAAPPVAATRWAAHARGGARPDGGAGRVQRRQVADGAAGHEHATGARRASRRGRRPSAAPGSRRTRPPRPRARTRRRSRTRRRRGRTSTRDVARGARDEGQVARVVGRQAGGCEVLGEQAQRLQTAEALGGDRPPDGGLELLRARRPVERRLHPDALLGVGDDGLGERRELDVLVLLVGLPVHGRESRGACRRGGTP